VMSLRACRCTFPSALAIHTVGMTQARARGDQTASRAMEEKGCDPARCRRWWK
jgi:hypothetical protein